MANYRKIYEHHYGEIPKDEDGRSYDIHHIDGNHANDSPDNLKAVTIQEHYNIHYSQNDWAACHRIAGKMGLSPAEISELARKNALQRVMNGTHPFLTRPDGASISSNRVFDGTHNLLGPENNRKRIEDGTHHLLRRPDGTSHATDRVADGTHPFLGGNLVRKINVERIKMEHIIF